MSITAKKPKSIEVDFEWLLSGAFKGKNKHGVIEEWEALGLKLKYFFMVDLQRIFFGQALGIDPFLAPCLMHNVKLCFVLL